MGIMSACPSKPLIMQVSICMHLSGRLLPIKLEAPMLFMSISCQCHGLSKPPCSSCLDGVHADAIRRVVREALNEGSERRSISGDVGRMAERNSIDTEDSLENDYLSWY